MAVVTPRTYTDITGTAPSVEEPTHTLTTGEVEPGAVDLRSTVTKDNNTKTIDPAWRKEYEGDDNRHRYSSTSPHLSQPYSTLETLSLQALRRYGDMHPGTVDGEVMLMFIEFANLILEDLRIHPYWDNPEIDYYTHMQETRPVPDQVMVSGLLYHYSIQQQSSKLEAYGPMYFKSMNRILYSRKYGSGPIQVTPWDKKSA